MTGGVCEFPVPEGRLAQCDDFFHDVSWRHEYQLCTLFIEQTRQSDRRVC